MRAKQALEKCTQIGSVIGYTHQFNRLAMHVEDIPESDKKYLNTSKALNRHQEFGSEPLPQQHWRKQS